MHLQSVKCLSRDSVTFRTSLQNRFKVQASLEYNESVEDLLNIIQSKLQSKGYIYSQDLQIKSAIRNGNNVTAVFEPKSKTKLTNYGLKIVSKTCNIFRDAKTDGMWKEVLDENGNKKYIRVQNENLAELIKVNSNLKLTAHVISLKDLKPGDLVVYVSTKGNMEAALVISEDFLFNLVQNKVVKMTSISSDDITNYKSNEDSVVEELDQDQTVEDNEKDLQNSLENLTSTMNILRKKTRSSIDKSDVEKMQKIVACILKNPVQQNRIKKLNASIQNF